MRLLLTHLVPCIQEQRGGAGVQRVRALLQAARGQQAPRHAQGRNSDQETKAEESGGQGQR